jgi:thiol-disulfide isomerase/thioredoxin
MPSFHWCRVSLIVWLASWLLLVASAAFADPVDDDCDTPTGACSPFDEPDDTTSTRPSEVTGNLLFFWGIGCPHCEQAKPFVRRLVGEFSQLRIESIEIRRDPEGRRRFLGEVQRLGIEAPGIPLFVHRANYVIGYQGEATERAVRRMLLGETKEASRRVDLPLFGEIDVARVGLPMLTVSVGLVDGINPCAIWVLLVLLGIMMHVRSRARLFLVGGTFVVMSGVVYFLFMTAWAGLFALAGMSRTITLVLGVLVLGMGLINLKELVWFKKGVSLVVSDRVKPGLYRRMRTIANAAGWPAAILGIVTLAFFVNLIELGCTLGLPAVYTRILSLQPGMSTWTRHAYICLYNVAYVVPLGVVVLVYAATLHRLALQDRGAKALKAVSGVLLTSFGLLFLLWPQVLE